MFTPSPLRAPAYDSIMPARRSLTCLWLAMAGCSDDGSCLLESGDQPVSCIEYSSQVSNNAARSSCTNGGGVWQDSSCSLEDAVGYCDDSFGSRTVYYPGFVESLGTSVAELARSCEEIMGEFTTLVVSEVGNACSLGDMPTDGTILASPALECAGQICAQYNGGTSMCTTRCNVAADCVAASDSQCSGGFSCVVPLSVGPFACQSYCICNDLGPDPSVPAACQ